MMGAVESPRVSVIVATNRNGPFFGEALASLRNQTYSHIDVVIVDDGSVDPDAVAKAAHRALPHARLLRQQPSGVSVARNMGAAVASGDFFVFLDDDDRWHPERIATQVQRLQQHPTAIACYCGMRTIDANGHVLIDADQIAVRSWNDVAARRTGILLPNLMISARAFRQVGGFDVGLHLAEDLDLLLRLAAGGDIVFEPTALVDYRTHGDNTTRKHHELTVSIDEVLRTHRARALRDGDLDLATALTESLRKNDRFAWWGAERRARTALRDRDVLGAAAELVWALRVAPRGLVSGLQRRVGGPRRRAEADLSPSAVRGQARLEGQ